MIALLGGVLFWGAGCLLPAVDARALPSPDGPPQFDPAIDGALLLWRETDGSWRLRVTGGTSYVRYAGALASNRSFLAVSPVSVDSTDTLDTSRPTRIDFVFGAYSGGIDGVDFGLPPDAEACMFLEAGAGSTVLLGADRTPMTTPFSLKTLGPCGSLEKDKPNLVLILTDDQRWDTLWAMPLLQEKLVARGVTFTNAFTTSTQCCPTRASILSGGFSAQHTGVLKNKVVQDPLVPLNGEIEYFRDDDTLATALQGMGYQTMLAGKYLNGYWRIAPYIPPGWTRFAGAVSGPDSDWYQYQFAMGSSTPAQSATGSVVSAAGAYVTEYEKHEILGFLDNVGDAPFFLYFAPSAPHHPATPGPGDEAAFSGYVYRGRGYGETDQTDKPLWVQDPDRLRWAKDPFYWDSSGNDEFHRNQLRSLQAVDRAVGAIVDKVEQLGKLNDTVFMFASDSGTTWGEHNLFDKGMAYEEVIRVPLVMRIPGMNPRIERAMVAADLDMPVTALALAGIARPSDGWDLVALLENPTAPRHEELLIQSWGYREGPAGEWAALRTLDWKLVEHPGGEIELYNLREDPFELESRHADPALRAVLDDLQQRLAARRGLTTRTFSLPLARLNLPYSAQLLAAGGTQPYRWSVLSQSPVLFCANRRRVPPPVALQFVYPCRGGTPAYDPGVDTGLILWKDEDGMRWHLRGMAGGGSAQHRGWLRSNKPFLSVTPVSIETEDTLDTSNPMEIRFALGMQQNRQDGVDFTLPSGAYVSLVVEGFLPGGLVLDGVTGEISGVPTTALSTTLSILVEDSSAVPYTGLPQRFVFPYRFQIAPW